MDVNMNINNDKKLNADEIHQIAIAPLPTFNIIRQLQSDYSTRSLYNPDARSVKVDDSTESKLFYLK